MTTEKSKVSRRKFLKTGSVAAAAGAAEVVARAAVEHDRARQTVREFDAIALRRGRHHLDGFAKGQVGRIRAGVVQCGNSECGHVALLSTPC